MSDQGSVQYLRKNYDLTQPHVLAAAAELGRMANFGVPLSRQLVDYVVQRASQSQTWRPSSSRADERTRLVYFLRVGDLVKIGYSVNPESRARSLGHDPSNIIAVTEGGYPEEQRLHALFADHRLEGTEWFAWCEDIANYVADLDAA